MRVGATHAWPSGRNPSPPKPSPEGEGLRAEADRYEAVHRCLLSGWPTQVGHKDRTRHLSRHARAQLPIFPGSALAKSQPAWVLAGQIIDLQKVYGMLCARVEPAWIEQQAAHLVRKSWRDVHWSRKRGAVVAFEQVTLFGLTLVEKRAVTVRQAGSEARARGLRARSAGARRDRCARRFRARERARARAGARARGQAPAQRPRAQRRRARRVLRRQVAEDIHSAARARCVVSQAATPPSRPRCAGRWPMCWPSRPVSARASFRPQLDVAGHRLRLDYRFVPGDPADGVTLHVPLALRERGIGGALRMAGAGPRCREGRRADSCAAQGAAPQFRAGAGLCARVRRGRGAARRAARGGARCVSDACHRSRDRPRRFCRRRAPRASSR